jgi:hypothetical protein
VKQQLHALGATIVGSTPAEFGKWIREDLARWAKVVKVANVEQQ